ncbi:MAG: PEP-CTERM sorting domain-containing protein [Bryobacteraceae bacterium]|nr:PEP-CTERM sorting domain-containing protein [Bryobacteraceae bacterium]
MKTLQLTTVFLAMALSALAAPCTTPTTFGDLQSLGSTGCQDQDKIYNNFDGTLPAGTVIDIESVLGLVDTHLISIGSLPIGVYTLEYLITIDPLTADYEDRNITQVSLGFDSAGAPGNSASKQIWVGGQLLDTLFSSGGIDLSIPFSAKSVSIMETITVTNSTYQSTTNAFTQEVSAIPEPGTYAMIGFGLLGLVLSRRRFASRS